MFFNNDFSVVFASISVKSLGNILYDIPQQGSESPMGKRVQNFEIRVIILCYVDILEKDSFTII